jgi:hypothetical protein
MYRKSARQWARIDVSLKIYSSSRYWTITELPRHEKFIPGGFIQGFEGCSLPQSLLKQIQGHLSGVDDQGENAAIHLSLPSNDAIQKDQPHNRNTHF